MRPGAHSAQHARAARPALAGLTPPWAPRLVPQFGAGKGRSIRHSQTVCQDVGRGKRKALHRPSPTRHTSAPTPPVLSPTGDVGLPKSPTLGSCAAVNSASSPLDTGALAAKPAPPGALPPPSMGAQERPRPPRQSPFSFR